MRDVALGVELRPSRYLHGYIHQVRVLLSERLRPIPDEVHRLLLALLLLEVGRQLVSLGQNNDRFALQIFFSEYFPDALHRPSMKVRHVAAAVAVDFETDQQHIQQRFDPRQPSGCLVVVGLVAVEAWAVKGGEDRFAASQRNSKHLLVDVECARLNLSGVLAQFLSLAAC